MYSALQRTQGFLHNLLTSDNATMWQQLISASCDIQTHRTGHTDRETGGSRMVRLPDFQMNHGDSGILNLTYRLDATN